jgi:hypothetical protein
MELLHGTLQESRILGWLSDFVTNLCTPVFGHDFFF